MSDTTPSPSNEHPKLPTPMGEAERRSVILTVTAMGSMLANTTTMTDEFRDGLTAALEKASEVLGPVTVEEVVLAHASFVRDVASSEPLKDELLKKAIVMIQSAKDAKFANPAHVEHVIRRC